MELPMLSDVQKEMIERFQCPGCLHGSNTNCGVFSLEDDDGMFRCQKHVPGTTMVVPGQGVYCLLLGAPKGFCRLSVSKVEKRPALRLWSSPDNAFQWNKWNISAWAMEQDGYLFVRTYSPRVDMSILDIIKDGKLQELCPQAIDASAFLDEMD